MSPPTRRGGPPPKQETARTPLPGTVRLIIPEAERQRQYPDRESMASGAHEVDPRAGDLVRRTTERVVEAFCPSCGIRPSTAGAAAAHARKSRHTVFVVYRAAFTFEPAPDPQPTTHQDEGWIR